MLDYGWNILVANVGKDDIPFHATHLNDHFQNQLFLLSHTLFSYVMATTNNDCMGIGGGEGGGLQHTYP
jgi:hypothetical protein